jgi:hypothetical protein
MRAMPLSTILAGMTRLRVKGGASQQSLYELLNGYVTNARSMQIRPGSVVDAKLPTDTKGLCSFKGQLYVFRHAPATAPSSKYKIAVCVHPTVPATKIKEIHFAGVYIGALYVAAEFTTGEVYHYWLEEAPVWKKNTVYKAYQLVQPTVANGYAYEATRKIDGYPAWAPLVPRAIGQKIEPSTYTGYFYEVTAVSGTNPISGTVEPTWPTNEGQTVIEELSSTGGTTAGTVPPEPGEPPPPSGGAGDTCVHVDSWMGNGLQAGQYFMGMMADCHHPERGFFRGPCKVFLPRELVPCVRIRTASTALIVSETTPVNYADAVEDLHPETCCLAPDLLGKSVLVEDRVEQVIGIDFLGPQWVQPMNFADSSFAASEQYGVPRIYTHNIIFKDPGGGIQ